MFINFPLIKKISISQDGRGHGCFFFFLSFFNNFLSFFIHFCAGSSCFTGCSRVMASKVYSLNAVRGPFVVAASFLVEHRIQVCALSGCGSWTLEHRLSNWVTCLVALPLWDLPRPGI